MKNYLDYMISKNNNKISDNKSYKNITNNSKLNKYFSIENQAKNYQDVPQRNLKKYNTSNFKETNIFPANKLKGEQRTLENKNKSLPKTNKKINKKLEKKKSKNMMKINYGICSIKNIMKYLIIMRMKKTL